jgi:hypothetical protein
MALTISQAGSGNSTSSSATLAVTLTQSFAVGDMVVVCIASDNNGTDGVDSVSSVTDSKSHTYTLRVERNNDPGAAAAGASVNIYTAIVTTAMTTSDVVTTNFSPNTASKAVVIWEVAPGAGETPTFVSNGSTTGDRNPALTSSSINSGNAVIYAIAAESRSTLTGDSDTTRGSWSALYTTAADTGTNSTSMRVGSQHKVVNATGTQAWSGTINDCDFALAYIILNPAGPATVSRTATGSGTGTQTATGLKTLVRDSYNNAHSDAIAAASIPASASLYQTYREVRGGATGGLLYPLYRAQQFTATTSSVIDKVELIVAYPSGTSAGKSISIQIASDDIVNGGNPPDPIPGTVIATSNGILETTIGTNAANNWISFTFPSAVSLTSGTKYWIIVKQDETSSSVASILHFSNYAYNGWSGRLVSFSWETFDNSDPSSSSVIDFRVIRKNAVGVKTKFRTATGSGVGTQTAAGAKFTATVYNRTATSSGTGGSSVLSGVLKELSLSSFSEPIKSGYDFYGYNPIPTNNGYWGVLTRIS